MKNLITENLSNPRNLEKLYRSNPVNFTQAFQEVYPQIKSDLTAQIWHERLRITHDEMTTVPVKDWVFVGVTALFVAFFMQLPDLLAISHDFWSY